MTNLIPGELHKLLRDYGTSQAGVDPNASFHDKKAGIEAKFQGDSNVNPRSLPLRDFFKSESDQELKQKIVEVREKKEMPSMIPLGEWVSLAESVVTNSDENTKANYDEMFETGLVQGLLRDNLRFIDQYEPRDLKFLVHNQSSEQNRSVVEVVSNAIDFSPQDGTVSVSINDHGFVVEDTGSGMNPQNIIEELSIPYISGAREKTKAAIGKFGMGFLTTLRHLKDDGDFVRIDTTKDGVGSFIEFRSVGGEIFVNIGRQEIVDKGTRVTLRTSQYDAKDAHRMLDEHLKYKRGACVLVNNEQLVALDNYIFVDVEGEGLNRSSIGLESSSLNEKTNCSTVVAINGIKVIDLDLEGYNLPKKFILDLPYSTNLSESRDELVYDQGLIANLKKIFEATVNSDLSIEDKTQTINILAEISKTVERQATTNQESALSYLEGTASKFLRAEGMLAIPAIEGADKLDFENTAFITPSLRSCFDQLYAYMQPIQGFRSSEIRGYKLPFKKDTEAPLLIFGKDILIDEQISSELEIHPEFLESYLQFASRNVGHLSMATRETRGNIKEGNRADENQPTADSYQEACTKALLNPEAIITNWNIKSALVPFSLMKSEWLPEGMDYHVVWEWDRSLDFDEVFYQKVTDFVTGKTTSIQISKEDFANAIEQHRLSATKPKVPPDVEEKAYAAFLTNANQIESIKKGLGELREVTKFFLPSNIEKYVHLPPDQIERRFVSDFIKENKHRLKDGIKQVEDWYMHDMETHHKYGDGPKPDRKNIPYNFDFVNSVLDRSYGRDHFSLENKKTLTEDIESKILGHATNVVDTLQAWRNYSWVRQEIPTEKQEYYDATISMPWGEIFSPWSLLKSRKSADTWGVGRGVDNNMSSLLGVKKLVDNIPIEFLRHACDKYAKDRRVPKGDLLKIMALQVDPQVAFHLIYNSGGMINLDREKIEHLMIALGDGGKQGIERIKGYFEKGDEGLAWRYRWQGYKTFAEYEIATNHIGEQVRNEGVNLFRKLDKIYELPSVASIFDQRSDDLDKAFSEIDSTYDSHRYGPYEMLSVYDAILRPDGLVSPITQRQLEIIEKTVKEHFNENFMDRHGLQDFCLYIRRATALTNLSDEDFTWIQPWLYSSGVDWRRHGSIFPSDFYDQEVIATLLENKEKITSANLSKVFEMWFAISDDHEFQRRQGIAPRTEQFKRVCDIVVDIGGKPKYIQEIFYDWLKDSKPPSNNSYRSDHFAYLRSPDTELTNVSSYVQPYVLYFRNGDRASLTKDLFPQIEVSGNQVNLTSLMHLSRSRSTTFQNLLDTPDNLADLANSNKEGKNMFIYQRELLHAINHLPANDQYLFLRELIQNAYDASTLAEGRKNSVAIDTYESGPYFVTQISDTVGMSFSTVFSKLLIPNVSSKAEGVDLGRFGVGFMSVFQGAERVEIVTADGKLETSVIVTPVYEDGIMIDLQIMFDTKDSNEHKTTIRKYAQTENSKLESAKVEAATNKYAAYLSPTMATVLFSQAQVNDDRNVIAAVQADKYGTLEYLEGANTSLLQGRLYVTDIDDEVIELIPEPIRDLVASHGVVINIGREVPLTRNRKEVADRNGFHQMLEQYIPALAIEATVNKFAHGAFDLNMIPYDYYWSEGTGKVEWQDAYNPQTIEDADRVNNGNMQVEWTRYSDRNNFLELLTLVKAIEVDGVKKSLREINELRKSGYEFKKDTLPPKIEKLLQESKSRDESDRKRREEYEQNKEKSFYLALPRGEVKTLLEEQSDAHLAFLDLVATMTGVEGVTHGFYNLPQGSVARAELNQRIKSWNLLYNDWNIEKLARMIGKEGGITLAEVYEFMARIINSSTHEDTHIELGVGHWGDHHTEAFNERQLIIWSSLLRKHDEIAHNAVNAVSKYKGTILDRRTLSDKLHTLAGANN